MRTPYTDRMQTEVFCFQTIPLKCNSLNIKNVQILTRCAQLINVLVKNKSSLAYKKAGTVLESKISIAKTRDLQGEGLKESVFISISYLIASVSLHLEFLNLY